MVFEAVLSGPPVPPARSIMATLPVSTDIADIPAGSAMRATFVSDFESGVAALLDGTSAPQVSVSSVKAGSSSVDFVIRPRSDCGASDCPALDVAAITETFAVPITLASGIDTIGPIEDVSVQPEIGFTKVVTSQAGCGRMVRGVYLAFRITNAESMHDCEAACTAAGAGCRAFSWYAEGTQSLEESTSSPDKCFLCDSESPAGAHFYRTGDIYARGKSCPTGTGMPTFDFSEDKCHPCPEGKLSPIEGYGACLDSCPYDFYEAADHGSCVPCPEGASTGSVPIPGGAKDASYCTTCAGGWYKFNERCIKCPEDGSATKTLTSGIGFALPGLLALAFYRAAENVLLEEQRIQSTSDSAKEAVAGVASTASMMTVVFRSLQFTTVAWQLEVKWPSMMLNFGSWFGTIALPDFAGILAVECQEGMDGPGAMVFKFVMKQGLFMALLVIFGVLSKLAPGGMKLRAVHALAASYSLLFMMYAKTMFDMTALTHHNGPDYFGDHLTLATVLSSGPSQAQTQTVNPGEFYYMDTMPEINTNSGATIFVTMGCFILVLQLMLIPCLYFTTIQRASQPAAYLDGAKLCVGKELWSEQFSAQFSWFYGRYKEDAWHHEFVLMLRKAALVAIPAYLGQQTLIILSSVVVIVLSALHHKQTLPFRAGKHIIEESLLSGTKVTQVVEGETINAGCCCCCACQWCWFGESMVEIEVATDTGETFRGLVPIEKVATLLDGNTKVYFRQPKRDATGPRATPTDKLELVTLGCLLGSYIVAELCYLLNDGVEAADRSGALDGLLFLLMFAFALAPPIVAVKLRREEIAWLSDPDAKKAEVEFGERFDENPIADEDGAGGKAGEGDVQ